MAGTIQMRQLLRSDGSLDAEQQGVVMNYANATPEGVPIGVWQSVVGEVARDLSWTDQGAYLAVEPFLKRVVGALFVAKCVSVLCHHHRNGLNTGFPGVDMGQICKTQVGYFPPRFQGLLGMGSYSFFKRMVGKQARWLHLATISSIFFPTNSHGVVEFLKNL